MNIFTEAGLLIVCGILSLILPTMLASWVEERSAINPTALFVFFYGVELVVIGLICNLFLT